MKLSKCAKDMQKAIDYKAMGDHLRTARLNANLTQEEVANAVEVSVTYYGKMELGKVRPSLVRLYTVCKVVKAPITYVLSGCCVALDEILIDENSDGKYLPSDNPSGDRKYLLAKIANATLPMVETLRTIYDAVISYSKVRKI